MNAKLCKKLRRIARESAKTAGNAVPAKTTYDEMKVAERPVRLGSHPDGTEVTVSIPMYRRTLGKCVRGMEKYLKRQSKANDPLLKLMLESNNE